MNYGSRDEITRGMRKDWHRMLLTGSLIPAEITEETIVRDYLDTAGVPDPGSSDPHKWRTETVQFSLMWQLAYTEFYFTDVPWPDFHKEESDQSNRKI